MYIEYGPHTLLVSKWSVTHERMESGSGQARQNARHLCWALTSTIAIGKLSESYETAGDGIWNDEGPMHSRAL